MATPSEMELLVRKEVAAQYPPSNAPTALPEKGSVVQP
jgi:hypothetical protein